MKRCAVIFLSAALLALAAGCAAGKPGREDEKEPAVLKSEELPREMEQTDMREKTVRPEQPETPREQAKPSELPRELPEADLTAQPLPADSGFVRVLDHVPGIAVDLKYAAADNFTGSVIYDFSDAYLRYGTVKKLAEVQKELEAQGLGLKIWDAFRPVRAQFRLWETYPDPTYVADPNKGFSSHSRGNTVDVTLVTPEGEEVEMPTGFDDFTAKANRDYTDCSETARENALLLEKLMEEYGFKPYHGEWWHFSDTTQYEADEAFDPGGAP